MGLITQHRARVKHADVRDRQGLHVPSMGQGPVNADVTSLITCHVEGTKVITTKCCNRHSLIANVKVETL